jgi:PAS domain S-box-containing protein
MEKLSEEILLHQARLLDEVYDAIIATDMDFSITYWNKAAERTYGWKSEETLGKNVDMLFQTDFIVGDQEHTILKLLQEKNAEVEVIHTLKNGSKINVATKASVVYGNNGQSIGTVGVLRDITEHKLIEQQLAFQASLLYSVHDAIIAVNDNLIITYWNRMADELFGWKEDEVMGKATTDIFGAIAPGSTREKAINKMMENDFYEGEIIYHHKDGHEIFTYVHARVIRNNEGSIEGIIFSFRDITDRKKDEETLRKSEERQAFLLKLSDALRPLSNPVELQSVVTHTAMDYFGADRCFYCEIENNKAIIRRDALRGDFPSIVGVYPLSSFYARRSLIEAGKPFIVNDVRTIEIDEPLKQLCTQLKVVSYIGVPVVKEGKPVGLLCVVQSKPLYWTDSDLELAVEISERAWVAVERASVEEALLKAERDKNEALHKSIEMKDEFLSIISHEFKTPITVINSAIQAMRLICKDELSDKANEFLRKILQNSNRQLKLVNNLLDISRINAGHMKTKKRNVDIVQVTRLITESIAVFAEQKGIRLLFSSTLKEKIIGIDDEKYERVLMNLLSNAIKFTPKGKSISVRVSQKVIKGRCNVCIKVRDQGIGIPQDKQQLIFERFGQVDSSLSRQAEGTGIGLSLVKMFVEFMEGEIALESDIGKGSTFTVLFPVTRINETPIEKMLNEINDNRLIQATAIEFSDIY